MALKEELKDDLEKKKMEIIQYGNKKHSKKIFVEGVLLAMFDFFLNKKLATTTEEAQALVGLFCDYFVLYSEQDFTKLWEDRTLESMKCHYWSTLAGLDSDDDKLQKKSPQPTSAESESKENEPAPALEELRRAAASALLENCSMEHI